MCPELFDFLIIICIRFLGGNGIFPFVQSVKLKVSSCLPSRCNEPVSSPLPGTEVGGCFQLYSAGAQSGTACAGISDMGRLWIIMYPGNKRCPCIGRITENDRNSHLGTNREKKISCFAYCNFKIHGDKNDVFFPSSFFASSLSLSPFLLVLCY